jgi:hypothetical protein
MVQTACPSEKSHNRGVGGSTPSSPPSSSPEFAPIKYEVRSPAIDTGEGAGRDMWSRDNAARGVTPGSRPEGVVGPLEESFVHSTPRRTSGTRDLEREGGLELELEPEQLRPDREMGMVAPVGDGTSYVFSFTVSEGSEERERGTERERARGEVGEWEGLVYADCVGVGGGGGVEDGGQGVLVSWGLGL